MFRRFFWDAFGISAWLRKHGIRPIAAVSLQNTGFRTGFNIPCFIYYHQSIPFVKNSGIHGFGINEICGFIRIFIHSL